MGILDPFVDVFEENRVPFWTFVVATLIMTGYVAAKGAGWSSLISGPFIGFICAISVKLALDKLKE